ncbi:MAG: hypothetical protein WCE68_11280 [Anaerolineales bacterium]
MQSKSRASILSALLIFLIIAACNASSIGVTNGTATPVPAATNTPVPGNPVLPTDTTILTPSTTPAPVASATMAPSATLAPSATPAAVATDTAAPIPMPANYIDDRSTPSQVIVSLYNAINRQEYLRAYNYWTNPASSLGSFPAYANGFQNTASVDLVFGQISGDAGMGQIYYTVPVILKTTAKDGTHANFAACYVVHQARPELFGEPPFQPMGIDRGSAKVSALNASDASVLATACNGYPTGPNPFAASGTSLDISKNNFLDNRSGPIETVSSFLNALNLKQYVRSYYYFQNPGTYPGAFDPYAAGYANTGAINVVFGTVQSEGAAGSLYYKVPLALLVTTTSNTHQTFVGCYSLRLGQPSVQATPPFQPMGIIAGKFTQVANGTNVNALLPTACN